MFKGNLANTIGELGEYGAFEDVKTEAIFGIYHKDTSGLLVGKEVGTFKMKVKSNAKREPNTANQLAKWAAANNVNAADYKVFAMWV